MSDGAAPVTVAVAAAPLSNHESFLLILHDAAGRRALFDFLKAGYSEHHLTFWEDVETNYKPLPSAVERDAKAREFWHLYIKNGAKSQINIHEPQRLRLQSAIEKLDNPNPAGPLEHAQPELFDEASAHCLELIKGNYFFPFQQSKQYAAFQAEKKQREKEEAEQKKKKEKSKGMCVIL